MSITTETKTHFITNFCNGKDSDYQKKMVLNIFKRSEGFYAVLSSRVSIGSVPNVHERFSHLQNIPWYPIGAGTTEDEAVDALYQRIVSTVVFDRIQYVCSCFTALCGNNQTPLHGATMTGSAGMALNPLFRMNAETAYRNDLVFGVFPHRYGGGANGGFVALALMGNHATELLKDLPEVDYWVYPCEQLENFPCATGNTAFEALMALHLKTLKFNLDDMDYLKKLWEAENVLYRNQDCPDIGNMIEEIMKGK